MAVFQVWKLFPEITRRENKIRLCTNTMMEILKKKIKKRKKKYGWRFTAHNFSFTKFGQCSTSRGPSGKVAATEKSVPECLPSGQFSAKAILPRKCKLNPTAGSYNRTVQHSSYIWRIRHGNRASQCTAHASLLHWELEIDAYAWACVKQDLLSRRKIIFLSCYLSLVCIKGFLYFQFKD